MTIKNKKNIIVTEVRIPVLFYHRRVKGVAHAFPCVHVTTVLSISTRSRPQKHYVFGVGFKKQRLFLAPFFCTRDDCLKIKKL